MPKAKQEGIAPSTDMNIFQRINAVMDEVSYVQKNKAAGMRYSIVSHDSVTSALHDAIVKHRIVYYPLSILHGQSGNRTEADMVVRFVNIDDPADYMDVATFGYGIDEQDKGPGKAMSYAVKYALLKAFGLETGDDPDNDQDVVYKAPANAVSPTLGWLSDGEHKVIVTETKQLGTSVGVVTDQGKATMSKDMTLEAGKSYTVIVLNKAITQIAA